MIAYRTRLALEKSPLYVSERVLDNKKLVVVGNPESGNVAVNFYRDNELLTDASDFTWNTEQIIELNDILASFSHKTMWEETIEHVADCLQKFLYCIKDPTIEQITITIKNTLK